MYDIVRTRHSGTSSTEIKRGLKMNSRKRIKGALAGKILRVNLSTGRMWTEASAPYAARTMGGRGTNSLIMLKEIKVGTKWDDPSNLLCFGVGSLVGTATPGACRTDIATINVFNGGKGSANAGGSWGAELKYAGSDHIIISGKAQRPVYLWICDDNVEIRDACRLWGKTISETENLLRQDLGPLSVAELEARIRALETEITRTRTKIESAVNHKATAEALFKR